MGCLSRSISIQKLPGLNCRASYGLSQPLSKSEWIFDKSTIDELVLELNRWLILFDLELGLNLSVAGVGVIERHARPSPKVLNIHKDVLSAALLTGEFSELLLGLLLLAIELASSQQNGVSSTSFEKLALQYGIALAGDDFQLKPGGKIAQLFGKHKFDTPVVRLRLSQTDPEFVPTPKSG